MWTVPLGQEQIHMYSQRMGDRLLYTESCLRRIEATPIQQFEEN